jgi:hypothetical protein
MFVVKAVLTPPPPKTPTGAKTAAKVGSEEGNFFWGFHHLRRPFFYILHYLSADGESKSVVLTTFFDALCSEK